MFSYTLRRPFMHSYEDRLLYPKGFIIIVVFPFIVSRFQASFTLAACKPCHDPRIVRLFTY